MDPWCLLERDTTCEGKDEGKGKGKDLRKKQRMDEAGDAIVPNSNEWYLECDFCKKECTGAWNESYTIWRRTCCLGMSRAPSGSSSVGPPNTLDEDATTSMPPPEIIQHMFQLRLDNPHMSVIKAMRCPFAPGGWAVACGGRLDNQEGRIAFEENKSKTNGLDKGDGDDP